MHCHKLFYGVLFSLVSGISLANKAPDFTLQGDDTLVKLSDFKGQVVYLDFWASWCVPCRQSFPFMNKMKENYADKGLKIIAVNLDEEQKKAKYFLNKIPAKFTIAYDPEGNVSKDYKLSVVPSFYLINRQGNIAFKHKGFRQSQASELEEKLKTLLLE